jgi:hypothetical protein
LAGDAEATAEWSGLSGAVGACQINMDCQHHRRQPCRLHPISVANTGGSGRNRAATAEATKDSWELGEIRVRVWEGVHGAVRLNPVGEGPRENLSFHSFL